ncbi:MAG: BamA/TamA family outer membrane protein [Bacteroidota bacterium]
MTKIQPERISLQVRNILLVAFLICSGVSQGSAQSRDSVPPVDIVEVIIKKFKIDLKGKKREDRKVYFSLFPTQGGVPSGGRALVTSFNAAFYLGDKSNTRISSIYFIPYISFTGKYGFFVRPNIWLSKNTWYFTGDYRILNYPQNTWGVEGGPNSEIQTVIDNDYFRFYQTAVKRVGTNWGLGVGYMLDHHYNISEETSGEFEGHLKPYSTKSSTTSSGLVFPLVYDSRLSQINPQNGSLLLFNYRFNSPAFGSDREWHSLYIDSRKYFPFSKYRQNLIALRGYYWTVLSGQAPYLDLPSIGWDLALIASGRGIQQSRYRSNALLYFESEYRFDITANGLLGGVVFSNVTSASVYGTQDFQSWHPAIGTGLRVKFNKYSRTNVLMDIAFSKGYTGLYLNIGEAF